MLDFGEKSIFVYDEDNNGASVLRSLIDIMHLDGKNFAMVTNRAISPITTYMSEYRIAKFESKAEGDRKFENVVNDNIFKLDYLLLDVYPIDRYFDKIDFIDIPVIFLTESFDGLTSFHTSRVPQDYKIFFMFREKKKNFDKTVSFAVGQHDYIISDIRNNKKYEITSLFEAFKRDRKISDILSKD